MIRHHSELAIEGRVLSAQRSTAAASLLLQDMAAMKYSTPRSASGRVVVACASPMHIARLNEAKRPNPGRNRHHEFEHSTTLAPVVVRITHVLSRSKSLSLDVIDIAPCNMLASR